MRENNSIFEKVCIECGTVIDTDSNASNCPNCGSDNFNITDDSNENKDLI